MRKQDARRPTLIDAMILVAATACGLAVMKRGILVGNMLAGLGLQQPPGLGGRILRTFPYVFLGSSPLLVSVTIAVMAMRLLQPRPPLRWIARQPGFVACLSVTTCLALEVVPVLCMGLNHGFVFLVCWVQGMGWSVGAGWMILFVGGRWQADPHWIDRAGRILGLAWLVGSPLAFAVLQGR